jgi:hypothetical protein
MDLKIKSPLSALETDNDLSPPQKLVIPPSTQIQDSYKEDLLTGSNLEETIRGLSAKGAGRKLSLEDLVYSDDEGDDDYKLKCFP